MLTSKGGSYTVYILKTYQKARGETFALSQAAYRIGGEHIWVVEERSDSATVRTKDGEIRNILIHFLLSYINVFASIVFKFKSV